MGGEASKQFSAGGRIFGDVWRGNIGVATGLLSTLSGHPDFSDVKKNWGDIAHAFKNPNEWANPAPPPTKQQIDTNQAAVEQQERTDTALKWWTPATNHSTSAAYSGMTVPPPSALMSIGDPETKVAMATSRGPARAAMTIAGRVLDQQMAPTLWKATGPSNVAPPGSGTG